jgi:hypothetical protein
MDSRKLSNEDDSAQSVRWLKIEEHGDFFNGRVKPKIRLMGHWLERAGFKPGTHVSVRCLSCGVIELRSEVYKMNEQNQASSDGLDRPF